MTSKWSGVPIDIKNNLLQNRKYQAIALETGDDDKMRIKPVSDIIYARKTMNTTNLLETVQELKKKLENHTKNQ